jgi:hypothetical protein
VTLDFRARCPKCNNCSFETPELIDVSLAFVCDACGHTGKLVEFADLSTLDAIVEDLKKRAFALKNRNGVKVAW